MRLPRRFFARPTLRVARELLGKYLIVEQPTLNVRRERLIGRIVETEAYIGIKDKACHASWRKRASCEILWGPPGQAYVYFTYGLHWLLNIVTEKDGFPAAVLIRALEPVAGIGEMVRNRATKKQSNKGTKDQKLLQRSVTLLPNYSKSFLGLANGPAKLTQALGINGSFNGEDLVSSKRIWVESRKVRGERLEVSRSKRLGVDYAQEYKDKPWRFFIKNNLFVSQKVKAAD